MRTIKSEILGELKQKGQIAGWWGSEPIEIPFFDNLKMQINYGEFLPEDDPKFIEEADKATKAFLQKSKEDRAAISHLVYKNCMDFLNQIVLRESDQVFVNMKDQNEIWNYVKPMRHGGINLSRRPHRDQDIYLEINCRCGWEDEHGLKLVFRQGRQITRVSAMDGCLTDADALGIPDTEDELLNKFKR